MFRTAIIAVTLASANLLSIPANAEEDGTKFLTYCNGDEGGEAQSFCFGKIEGVAMTVKTLMSGKPAFCIPVGTENSALVSAVTSHLKANRAAGSASATEAIVAAFKKAFPC